MMRKLILVSTLVLSSSVAFAQFTGPSVERDFEPRADRMGQMQDRSGINNSDDRRMNRQHRQQMNQETYRQNHPRGEYRQMHNNDRRDHRQYQQNNESRHGQYHRTNHRSGEMRQHSGQRQQMHSQRHFGSRHQMHQRQDCPYNN